MKVNMLLDLVGQLVASHQTRPPPVRLRFNAMGAIWHATRPLPELGTHGVVEIYLRDSLPQPLRLVGRISSVSPDGRVKARFLPPGELIADLLEKFAFRRHRRQIAGARHPKNKA